MKIFIVFFMLLSMISCQNNTEVVRNSNKQIEEQSKIDSLKSENPKNDEVDFSEINWNTYLKKNNFEQSSSDSILLVVVKPDYAIFVFAQENMDTDELVSYDISGFQRQNNKWVKTINEQISDLEISDYFKDRWRLEDINGDGYNDILLKIYHDGKQNKRYVCFLQKPEQKKFIKLDWFSKKGNPEYDSKTKILSSSSAFSKGMIKKEYRWIKDTLKLIKGERMGEIEEEFYEDKYPD